jgi:hypothetical protein
MLIAQDAGKAGMALDATKFADEVLRVVTVRELKQHHPAGSSSAFPSTSFMPSSVKFGAKKKREGKR